MNITAVLFLFAVLWLAPACTENKNQQFVTHNAFQNRTCHSSFLLNSSVCVGIMSCAWQCALADLCASFFYVPETRRCDKCLVNVPSTNQSVALPGLSSSFYRKNWNITDNTAAVTVSTVTVTSSTVTVTSRYSYVACIALVTGRDTNTTTISDNEAVKCGESCKGFPAFATKGQKCTCTEIIIVSDNPSKCTFVCPGNENEYCGEGDDNHHASLYYFN